MNKIEIKEFIAAVEKRAEELGRFSVFSPLSLKERAICEATVYFLNKIITEKENKVKRKANQKALSAMQFGPGPRP